MPSTNDTKYDPEGKGKPDEGLLLAAISANLQALETETPSRDVVDDLAEQLDILSTLAAGNMHIDIRDRSHPKDELAEIWALAFEKLYGEGYNSKM